MTQLLTWLAANPGLFIISLFAIGGMGSFVINAAIQHRQLGRAHELKMAHLKAQTETAKALAAAPEEAQRSALAQELLEAYGEAGEGLRNDEKGSSVRYGLTKES